MIIFVAKDVSAGRRLNEKLSAVQEVNQIFPIACRMKFKFILRQLATMFFPCQYSNGVKYGHHPLPLSSFNWFAVDFWESTLPKSDSYVYAYVRVSRAQYHWSKSFKYKFALT